MWIWCFAKWALFTDVELVSEALITTDSIWLHAIDTRKSVSANKVDPRHCYLIVRNSVLYSSDNVSTLFCRYWEEQRTILPRKVCNKFPTDTIKRKTELITYNINSRFSKTEIKSMNSICIKKNAQPVDRQRITWRTEVTECFSIHSWARFVRPKPVVRETARKIINLVSGLASCYRNQDEFRPVEPLGSCTD